MTATGIEPTTTWLTVRLQTFWYRACFKQGVPWHSANYRVQIHSKRACDVLKRHSLLMGQFWLEIAKKKNFFGKLWSILSAFWPILQNLAYSLNKKLFQLKKHLWAHTKNQKNVINQRLRNWEIRGIILSIVLLTMGYPEFLKKRDSATFQ